MAESTGSKNKKTLDAFADDLDAMLNIGDSTNQEVGTIEDDEAIDRLLVGDESFERNAQQEIDDFADIDDLLEANSLAGQSSLAEDIDEFDTDFASDIGINPSREQSGIDDALDDVVEAENQQELIDMDEFADDFANDIAINPGREQTEIDSSLADLVNVENQPAAAEVFEEVAELERVGEIADFADQAPVLDLPAAEHDELEDMTEIDEFSEDAAPLGNNADFLMADFDISADDEPVMPVTQQIDEFDEVDVINVEQLEAEPDAELVLDSELLVESVAEQEAEAEQSGEDDLLIAEVAAEAAPIPEPLPPPVQVIDHSADITTINRQIVDLKKHHQQTRHDLTELAGKAELTACLDSLDSLQTEQKKTKRAVDAIAAKKPVAAYVANGVAALALLVGTGLGIQGMIAKSQVDELVTIIGKLQEQVSAAPTNDAADKEMLRKQLDELTVSSGVMSTQIAELSKAAHSEPAPSKAGADQPKQTGESANQLMQIGAAIETLQSKVNALEKGRTVVAAPAPKPEKKKPVVVEENWAVNLIAFKQDWYAKSKADEFAGKGVPAKVVKTEAKGENWYRLYVDGFKSQYEAAAYAAKIKKTLNLDSVWVTRNKD